MIEIQNKNLFCKIVADALSAIELNGSLQTWEKIRWVNAIAKAVCLIEEQPEFMEYHAEQNMLTVWNTRSNKVYNANGQCECEAAKRGTPCKHRAAKQLIKNYLAAENMPPQVKAATVGDIRTAPYLKPATTAKPQTVGNIRI